MTVKTENYKLPLMMEIKPEDFAPRNELEATMLASLQNFHKLQDDLLDARHSLSLSQVDVARILGMTQPAVSAFESSGSETKILTLITFAAAVGVEIEFVMRNQFNDESKKPTKADA